MLHIGFYQLGDASVNDAVLMLVQKARGTGKKMLIFCPNPAAAAIDDALWIHDQNSCAVPRPASCSTASIAQAIGKETDFRWAQKRQD